MTEVVDPYLGIYDELCLTTGVFPEHVCEQYDKLCAAAEKELARIGAAARADESTKVKKAPLELTAKEETVHDGQTERPAPGSARTAGGARGPGAGRVRRAKGK